MADIAVQTLSWSSDSPVLTVTTPTNTQVISDVDKNTTIVVFNDTAGNVALVIKNQVQDKWSSVVTTQDAAVTIATKTYRAFSGPFLCNHFRDSDEDVTLTFDIVVDVEVMAFKAGP